VSARAVVLAPADAGLTDRIAAPGTQLRPVGVPWGLVVRHAGDRTRRVLWRGTSGAVELSLLHQGRPLRGRSGPPGGRAAPASVPLPDLRPGLRKRRPKPRICSGRVPRVRHRRPPYVTDFTYADEPVHQRGLPDADARRRSTSEPSCKRCPAVRESGLRAAARVKSARGATHSEPPTPETTAPPTHRHAPPIPHTYASRRDGRRRTPLHSAPTVTHLAFTSAQARGRTEVPPWSGSWSGLRQGVALEVAPRVAHPRFRSGQLPQVITRGRGVPFPLTSPLRHPTAPNRMGREGGWGGTDGRRARGSGGRLSCSARLAPRGPPGAPALWCRAVRGR
jgi:hypothetical protein